MTYSKIEIKSGNYEATNSKQTVEKVEEKSQTIADIIEETTKKCSRNFKTKKCRKLNIIK